MRIAAFKSYKNGYYNFWFENGEELAFEDVHPRVLKQFDLKNDKSLIDKDFKITFVEDEDGDDIFYRIESLKPL
ncbi:hypothetical protein JJL45_04905 [Tamlana sp. s12]|uniref:Uncharacterized protein n=1 Tax=Pseudotamlana carrageenivorans TaxID=2069432 RepID=A0A2I7SI01_9FLAO|nr:MULTISPECIES: hypothetical protein [Tamlana]AUS05531.1 hypothetical protein C1A40_08655 [Tamlana carrageenivorans]OBQ56153.1 hypothetical protein VQ01_07155 [Tamlana sp. s12]QQY83331.1 hypothetical protein JJL45_04905 [Tamlana sp. s12]